MILKLGKRFLCFFDMSLQKNAKSHVFLDFEKNEKNVFSNYAGIGVRVAGARTGVHYESQPVHCLMDAVELVVDTVEVSILEQEQVVHVQMMAL